LRKLCRGGVRRQRSGRGPDIVTRLRERAPACSESWLGVLGVERLLVFPGQQALVPEIRQWLSDWRESMVGSAVAFERLEHPSLLACLPSKLSAEVRGSSDREIVLAVANRAHWPRRLVLRRQW